MGNGESLWRKLHTKFQRRTDVRVLMIGLNNAGKTTILYQLKNGVTPITIPTVGFNVETITYKGVHFTTWDVSGKSRSLWRYYYPNTEVLILVVDSNDRDRMDECRDELAKLMCEEKLRECCLLIMANKQDLPNAMSVHEMTNKLDLNKLPQTCTWYVQDCCATNGDGLHEGLGWVKSQLTASKQGKKSSSSSSSHGESEGKEPHRERRKLQASWLSFSNWTRSNHGTNSSTDTHHLL